MAGQITPPVSSPHTPLFSQSPTSTLETELSNGGVAALQTLLKRDPNFLANFHELPGEFTPLHLAVERDDVKLTVEILNRCPKLATRLVDGKYPLQLAVEMNHQWIIKVFAAKCPTSIRVMGYDSITPFIASTIERNTNAIRVFLKSCPEVLEDATSDLETGLHLAASTDNWTALTLMLIVPNKTRDPLKDQWSKTILNKPNINGDTVLHLCCDPLRMEGFRRLMDYSTANPTFLLITLRNSNNQTPIQLAQSKGNAEAVRLLKRMRYDLFLEPRSLVTNWVSYFDKFGEIDPDKVRGTILVAVVLLYSLLFQVPFNPPGGLDDKGHSRLDPDQLKQILILNSVALSLMVFVLSVLLVHVPLCVEIFMAGVISLSTYREATKAIWPEVKTDDISFDVIMALILVPTIWFFIRPIGKKMLLLASYVVMELLDEEQI